MAKPELGAKRTCQSCGSKYYDLMRDPIVCPKCGATFVATVVVSSAAMARSARAESRKPVRAPEEDEPVEAVDADEENEAISLEDADDEVASPVKKAAPDVDADDDEEVDDSDDDDDDDETFLEPDEGDEDVTDIIGDREKDDET